MTAITCPGCGLAHNSAGLAVAPDLEATGECLQEFGTVSAPFYGEAALVPQRQYVVDAYACQHPSTRSRRAIQTTALCLMTLDLVFEACLDVALGPRLHQQMMRTHPDVFVPLAKPDLTNTLTYRQLAQVPLRPELLGSAARQWAESVWQAWRGHHDQVRRWNQLLVPQWLPDTRSK